MIYDTGEHFSPKPIRRVDEKLLVFFFEYHYLLSGLQEIPLEGALKYDRMSTQEIFVQQLDFPFVTEDDLNHELDMDVPFKKN